jgi:hypothetical protein
VPAAEPRIVYSLRAGATPETELDALAAIYSFCRQMHRERQSAAEATVAQMRDIEEVSDVKQQPDRPSEIVVSNSRKLRNQ